MARSAGLGRKREGDSAKRTRAGRDFEALRQRRMQAAEMFRQGKRQVEVAEKLGVSQPTASRWHQLWLSGGRTALVGAGRAGRRPKLSDVQLGSGGGGAAAGSEGARLPDRDVDVGPGGRGDRAGDRVRLGTTQTWAVMLERLGWSVQRPARRARERNDEAIATWVKQEWPRIKKRAAARRLDRLPGRIRVGPVKRFV
jgi:transposase